MISIITNVRIIIFQILQGLILIDFDLFLYVLLVYRSVLVVLKKNYCDICIY